MMAPPEYEIRQSGRVLELQNRDLWLRPTDMSWHFPLLITIREEPFETLSFKHIREVESHRRTRSKKSRRRRPRKVMMDGMMPNGNHHLGHGNSQLTLGLVFIFILATVELRPNA